MSEGPGEHVGRNASGGSWVCLPAAPAVGHDGVAVGAGDVDAVEEVDDEGGLLCGVVDELFRFCVGAGPGGGRRLDRLGQRTRFVCGCRLLGGLSQRVSGDELAVMDELVSAIEDVRQVRVAWIEAGRLSLK